MLFNNFTYILFFLLVTLFYFVIPEKLKWSYLLVISYGFYMNWNPSYALLLLSITTISYIVGISIEVKKTKNYCSNRHNTLPTTSDNIQIYEFYQ